MRPAAQTRRRRKRLVAALAGSTAPTAQAWFLLDEDRLLCADAIRRPISGICQKPPPTAATLRTRLGRTAFPVLRQNPVVMDYGGFENDRSSKLHDRTICTQAWCWLGQAGGSTLEDSPRRGRAIAQPVELWLRPSRAI